MIERYGKSAYKEAKELIWKSNLGNSEKIFMDVLVKEASQNQEIIEKIFNGYHEIETQHLKIIPEKRKIESFHNYMVGIIKMLEIFKGG